LLARLGLGGQVALLGLVVWFAASVLGEHWHELRMTRLTLVLRPGWLALSGVATLVTYAFLISAWRGIVLGWGEHIAWSQAVRVWTLSNLGRYLPGKVWSVAGLAVLAQRAGVSGWAAVGAAVAIQSLVVGTGVAVVVAAAPAAASPLWLASAAVVAAATMAALGAPPVVRVLNRLVPSAGLRPLGGAAAARAALAILVSWVGYGLAFWCLARGLLGASALPLAAATGAFAAGNVIGLIALFAPGGLVVREGVLVALLTPALGPGPALALSVGSRILLTLTELVAGAVGLSVRSPDRAGRG
jgi:hypothetical protein